MTKNRTLQTMKALAPKETDPKIARNISPFEGFQVVDVPIPQVQEGQVLIRVQTVAINRADILQRKGLYPPPAGVTPVPGLECAGEIVQIGNGCRRQWKERDVVMAILPGGGYADYCAVDESCVIHVPSVLNVEQAASIPEVWITAYQLLYWITKAQRGEWVLVHAGASGVGLAAIQLARKCLSCQVIATAGSPRKLEACIEYGADAAFNYKESAISENVLSTCPNGVEVILDCVGASMWNENVRCLREDGRWVLYGTLGGAKLKDGNLTALLMKRLSFFTTTLRGRSNEYKANLVKSFEQEIIPRIIDGTCVPVIDNVFEGVEGIAKAHAYIESNANIGKVVVKWTNH
eukprot:jgi/Galph1/1371/GphlegSOOS_G5958.1